MLNFIKFSDFIQSSPNDSTTQNVGLASGLNVRNPKFLSWTTAMRPSAPFNGLLGFNTDLEQYEYWNALLPAWVQLANSAGGGTVNPGTTGELGYYASNGTAISGLSVSPESVLGSNTSGFPTWIGPLINGQLIIGKTGFTPVAGTLTAGSGISIVEGAGTITISSSVTGGTVTSVSQGAGIVCTPNPIVSTGTVALAGTLPAGEIIPQPTIQQGVIQQPIIQGITNGAVPSAGQYGEQISSNIPIGTPVNLPNSTPTDITSIMLTKGYWHITGNISILSTVANSAGFMWMNTVSATFPDKSKFVGLQITTGGFGQQGLVCPDLYINTASNMPIYLTCQSNFTSGTSKACGTITAIRIG